VLRHVLRGQGNKQIGVALGITEQAVKEHVSTLLDKFDVPNRAALAEAGTRMEFAGELGFDRSWMRDLFLDAQPQICIARGPEIRYEAANAAFLEAVGHRPVIGLTMREAFPEIADQGVFELVESVYKTGIPVVQHEVRRSWDRGNGVEERLIDVVIQPLHDADGKVNGITSFVLDVTDQVERRRRTELVREELAALLDLLPSGVIVVDENGRVIRINEAGSQIAAGMLAPGMALDEQARALFAIRDMNGNDIPDGETPVARALRGEDIGRVEFSFVSGTPPRRVRATASVRPLRDPDGRVRGAVCLFNQLDPEPV